MHQLVKGQKTQYHQYGSLACHDGKQEFSHVIIHRDHYFSVKILTTEKSEINVFLLGSQQPMINTKVSLFFIFLFFWSKNKPRRFIFVVIIAHFKVQGTISSQLWDMISMFTINGNRTMYQFCFFKSTDYCSLVKQIPVIRLEGYVETRLKTLNS